VQRVYLALHRVKLCFEQRPRPLRTSVPGAAVQAVHRARAEERVPPLHARAGVICCHETR